MRALSRSALMAVAIAAIGALVGCSSGDSGTSGADPDAMLDGTAHDGVTLDEGTLRDTTIGGDTTSTGDTSSGGDTTSSGDTDTSSDTATTSDSDDAGAMCVRGASCSDGALSCLCCAAGGPRENCTCSTKCTKDADCTDPSRPKCNQQAAGIEGFCTSTTFMCCWLCK
jgi:hypothetical protein